jgi:hypothetical protein
MFMYVNFNKWFLFTLSEKEVSFLMETRVYTFSDESFSGWCLLLSWSRAAKAFGEKMLHSYGNDTSMEISNF